MICGMTLYQILWYFMIYSLIGWMIEVSYHAITLGKVVNRGFLNGPICPVYGSGVIMVLLVLYLTGIITGFETDVDVANPFLLFIIGILFATLIEFLAGFILDKLFHARWWDYSDRKFNVNGYICLEFSIIWGLAIAFVLRVVQPTFEGFVDFIPHLIGMIFLVIMYLTFIADIVITVLTVLKLNRELEKMEDIQKSILKLSDGMSEMIGTGTIKTMNQLEKGYEEATEKKKELREAISENKSELLNTIDKRREDHQLRKAELEERLENMRANLMHHNILGTGRLLTAFPRMKHHINQEIVNYIQNKMK